MDNLQIKGDALVDLYRVKSNALTMTETAARNIEISIATLTTLMDEARARHLLNEKVKLILTAALNRAHSNIITRLEQIVTSALNTVYGSGHKFHINLVERRNQREVDFYIEDKAVNIQLKKPFVGKGGGKVTIAAFALQLAVIEFAGVQGPIFLDEITKYVDSEAVERVAKLISDYSINMGKQLINITHHEAVVQVADVSFIINKNSKGIAIPQQL